MQVIALQVDICWEDKQATYHRVEKLMQSADLKPEALIVLPEMFATGFSMKVSRIEEGKERPTEHFMAKLARDWGVFVCGGVVNRYSNQLGLNQSVTFNPNGKEIARYTKCHPFSFAKEDQYYARGDGPICYDWKGITVAPLICYDLRFPELFRIMAKRGAQLYTVIANWPQRREMHWLNLLQARAIENQAYVIGVNRCGQDPWLSYGGRSLIINPKGEIIADAGTHENSITAGINLNELLAYRAEFPALEDIRTDFIIQ